MNSQKTILSWTKALVQSLDGKPKKERGEIFKRLVRSLAEKKKNYLLPRILKKAENIVSRRNKIELTLSRGQSPVLAAIIKKKLQKTFGEDKEIEIKEDEGTIGGFRARSENFLIKATVKDFLDLLKEKYQHGGN